MEPVKTPKQRQREQEADHEQEQEQEQMKGQNDPRCLEWGAWRAPGEARRRRVYRAVKRLAEMSGFSTTERGCTQVAYRARPRARAVTRGSSLLSLAKAVSSEHLQRLLYLFTQKLPKGLLYD